MIDPFIETKSLFVDQDGEKLKPGDFTFDARRVVSFNKASDEINTTVRLSDGESYTVSIPYKGFKELLMSAVSQRL